MGSYGIGPARILAAAIEQYADVHGISWPRALAPFEVQLVGLGKAGTEEHQLAERLYAELLEAGIDVLYDDRDMRPGEKFVEAELLGCPLRVVAGKRSVRRARGAGPARHRAAHGPDRERRRGADRAARRAGVTGRAGGPRRLLGLRRGADPVETRAGQPLHLHPFTLPNLIGFARVGLLAVFAAVAFASDDGREPLSTVCYTIAAAGDYLDGMVARLTGQYSRLGALMDPFIDRLVVVVGIAVVWHFELLPRWALAVLVAREVLMLVLVLAALRLGLDLHINWLGRISVWFTMGAMGAALLGWDGVKEPFLYVGLAGSLAASAQYVRAGLRELRSR
jgi:cardiolipin synthase